MKRKKLDPFEKELRARIRNRRSYMEHYGVRDDWGFATQAIIEELNYLLDIYIEMRDAKRCTAKRF